jgi:threonine dehydrogenase-like Zn-dependent dehydrogenase
MGTSLFHTLSGTVVVETPIDRVAPGKRAALVQIIGATICEADRRYVTGSKRIDGQPDSVTLGHEAVGRVVDVGEDAKVANGDIVVVMPHQVPDAEQHTEAFRRGEIFRLHTHHAGMHVNGTLASHVEWPSEWLRVITPGTQQKAADATTPLGVHWSLAVAETEHLACVMTAFDLFQKAESRWKGRNLSRLQNGRGQVLISGSGWMGYLWFLHLTKHLPNAQVWLEDPSRDRLRLFRQLALETSGREVHVVNPFDLDLRGKFDLGVMTTAARPAAHELLSYLRPGGHLSLFSGIHDGATNLLLDPGKLADMERIHRDGLDVKVFRTAAQSPDDMVIASGSSGYSVACFDRAVTQIGSDYARGIAAGISGIVGGIKNDRLASVRSWAPALTRAGRRPVLEQLFEPEWPGRAEHLKVGVHPTLTTELEDFYRETFRQGA